MKSLVSVIVPVYNGEKFINETLHSVINQEYTHWELLVVDDGSTDKVGEIVGKLSEQDLRIKYFHQLNKGVSAARNLGIQKSTGQYLAFLDADDVWLPQNIKVKVELLEGSDCGLVHSDGAVINEESIPTGKVLSGQEGAVLDKMLEWKESVIPGPSSILVKKEVVDKIGFFDTRLSTAADQDFLFRVTHAYKIGKIPEVTWYYRVHSSNMHKNIDKMEKDVLTVFQNAKQNRFFHSYWFQRKCFANMYLILAASWAGDGKNYHKAFSFACMALFCNPIIGVQILRKLSKKWMG